MQIERFWASAGLQSDIKTQRIRDIICLVNSGSLGCASPPPPPSSSPPTMPPAPFHPGERRTPGLTVPPSSRTAPRVHRLEEAQEQDVNFLRFVQRVKETINPDGPPE